MNFCGLRKELDEQMKASDRELSDLNGKLQLLQHEHSLDLSTWSDKVGHLRSANHGQIRKMPTDCIISLQRSALETALTETEKELAIMRGDRDAAVRREAQIESRFTDMQVRGESFL